MLGVIVVCSYDLCQFEVIVHCYSTHVPGSCVVYCTRKIMSAHQFVFGAIGDDLGMAAYCACSYLYSVTVIHYT